MLLLPYKEGKRSYNAHSLQSYLSLLINSRTADMIFFNAKYLENGTRQSYTYQGKQIESLT